MEKFWRENVHSTPTSITSTWIESTESHVISGGGVAVCLCLLLSVHHAVIFAITQLSCLPIMSDYTLIASKQSTRDCWHRPTRCILCLGHYDLAFFSSGLAVNYVSFGTEHRKLHGSPDIVRLHLVTDCPFCVYKPLHFCKLFANPNIDLEYDRIFEKPMKRRFQRYLVYTEILSTFHTRVEYISVAKYAFETDGSLGKTP